MSELAARFRHAFFRIDDPAERIRTLKALLGEEREAIRNRFLTGASASATTADLSDLVDAFLRALLEARRNYTPAASRLSLVAVGGYGRREMCPKSDVDLLILIPRRASPEVLAEAEQILYPLWDMGFVVGQAVRTIPDCKKAADEDVETYTAFLQERFLGGDFSLYREFADFVADRPSGRRQRHLTAMKLAERDKRLLAQGQLAQTLEPNLKEGRGCLRDLHTLVWLAGIQCGARNLDDLVRSGIVGPEELGDIREANEFLLRARIALHYATDQKSDRMGFDDQQAIAATMGYLDAPDSRGVERFQKAFYQRIRMVDSITTQYCDAVASQGSRRARAKSLDPRFQILDGSLEVPVEGANPFLSNIEMVLDLFRTAQRARVGVGASTRWYVRQAVSLVDSQSLDLPRLLPKLLEIMRHSSHRAVTLRELHRVGVLSLVVPDFALIDCHSQHDIYHLYTTDEHTLTVLSRLATLPRSEDPVLQHLKGEFLKIPDLDILYIAALFHDIGKGLGADHSDSGARLVRAYCRRAGISDSRASQAADLVQHHLLLNFLAQRRDIEDPRTIRELLAKLGDAHLLRKLYVLTWADTSSVHPDAWSAWKANLLLRLYNGAMLEFEQEGSREHIDSDSRREALAQEGFGHPREEILEHLRRLPRRYASSVSARQVADHLDLLQAISPKRRCAVKARNHGSHWDLAIVMADRPGLLARICAALTTLRLSIATAQVYTRVDGVVIDLFSVIPQDPDTSVNEEELALLAEKQLSEFRDIDTGMLQASVDSHIERWSSTVTRIMTPKVRVEFHSQGDLDCTLLDITAGDRLGLLFDLTLYLSKRQWVIHSARVCTEADKAMDSFSLTTPEGRPILDEEVLRSARSEISKLLTARQNLS
ncbi:MAG: [protein-PII] uridylyltransferase [Fibrobacteria bacterium]|nr:[protein-PII] uridylyltransferase [Fibrobacteria bacterium]